MSVYLKACSLFSAVSCLIHSVVCSLDEWSQQEMETFSRHLIGTNKDFSLVAKQVAYCLLAEYFINLLCKIHAPSGMRIMIIIIIRPPGTVVQGGLMFCCGFFFLSFFCGTLRRYIS